MRTFTAAVRRRITADWLELFPELGQYKSLHLLRRVGPLLQGVVLERTSGNDLYRPTFHVHCLLRKSSVVTMTLAHRLQSETTGGPDAIPIVHHASRYIEAARALARQSPLPLSGGLNLPGVLKAYRQFAGRPGVHYDANSLYEDMAALCGWLGDSDGARRIIAEGLAKLAEWPRDILSEIGGRAAWHAHIADVVADRKRLLDMVDEQVDALRLQAIPVSTMVFG